MLRTLLAGLVLSGCAIPGGSSCGDFRLDAARWRQPESMLGQPSQRQKDADRLVDCDVLIGKTRAQVTEMLGPPTTSPNGWFIGAGDGLEGSSEILAVEYGPDGKVAAAGTGGG